MKSACKMLMFICLGGSLGAIGHSAMNKEFWVVFIPVCLFSAIGEIFD